jgi:hypothetical protein
MELFRRLLLGVLAAGPLSAVEPPKLCALLPAGHGLTIPYLYVPPRLNAMRDLAPQQVACGQPAQCLAGTGQFERGVTPGSAAFRVVISMYKSPEEARGAMSRYGGRPNSTQYGDSAIVYATPQTSAAWFTRGSYYVEIDGLGPYASRVNSLAAHIDQGIQRLPAAACEAPGAAGKPEPMVPSQPNLPARAEPNRPAGAAEMGKAAVCFKSDPSAGLLDAARHRAMAAGAPREALGHVLGTRIRTIGGCSQATPDQWSSLYATISVAVAKRFRDARCFANDTSAINPDWNFHKRQRPPRNSADDLIFKTDQALNCLPEAERAGFFAEVAGAIAASMER